MTALHSATACSLPYMLEFVLDRGFTPIDARNANGCTALYFTARLGHRDPTKLLLSRGARVDARNDNGITALLACASEASSEHEDDRAG